MARKKTPAKDAPTKHGKRAIDDNFVAPRKRKPAEKPVTLAEALAESGEDLTELTHVEDAPTPDESPVRPAGTSNLACTIRQHRHRYQPMLHPNGKKTQNNGDVVAQVLLFVPLAALKDYAGMRFDGRRYDHLNDGHARMCIGNLIRAAFNKGESDVIEQINKWAPKQEAEEPITLQGAHS